MRFAEGGERELPLEAAPSSYASMTHGVGVPKTAGWKDR